MPTVRTELSSSGVLTLTLNRPESLNAIDLQMRAEFSAAMNDAARDDQVRVVVVTGAGTAFCAGADLREAVSRAASTPTSSSFRRQYLAMQDLHDSIVEPIFRCMKPTIALVNGAAAGGGFGVALACDFRIASKDAIFVSSFARIGLSGDSGVTWGLSRIVGRAKALDILMLSPRMSAKQALEMGLVREVVESSVLMSEGLQLADRLASGPIEAFAVMKLNLEFAEIHSYAQSLDQEACGISINKLLDENAAAVSAFLEKREPGFQ